MTNASASSPSLGLELPQPLDGSAEGELSAAEAFDEVPATTEPERLERLQLAVDGAEPPGIPSARTPSRVTMPCRSSRSSASARRSGTCPASDPTWLERRPAATSGPGSR